MKKVNKITKKELEKIVEQQKTLNEMLTGIGVLETQKHGLLHKVAELNKNDEVLPWKKFNSNMAISIEYDIKY